MAKSVIVTYILWLVGGLIGLHHVYLGRDRQALVWWCTAGGCLGLGWVRDLFRIPEYVDEANGERQFVQEMKSRKRHSSGPPFSSVRFFGELVMGSLYGFLIRTAVPEEIMNDHLILKILDKALVPMAVAIGVNLVANIGQERASLKIAGMGAFLTMPMYIMRPSNITYMAVTSALAVNWKGKIWRLKTPKQQHICKRLFVLTCCACLYSSLWTVAVYHNAYITTQDQEKVRLKDALWNFFTSPAWEETKATIYKIFTSFERHGFWGAWEEFVVNIDPEGEYNSYRVLGVTSQATEEEIAIAYRSLVREWHPDKHKDAAKKKSAETRFMQIQQAYETISKIKGRRAKKNRRN